MALCICISSCFVVQYRSSDHHGPNHASIGNPWQIMSHTHNNNLLYLKPAAPLDLQEAFLPHFPVPSISSDRTLLSGQRLWHSF
jgi:hypothetical protein